MRRLLCALLLGLGLFAATPAFAGAAQDPGLQECIDKVPVEVIAQRGAPSCRSVNGGELEPYYPEPETPGGSGFFALVGVLMVVALVWSAIPVFASYSIAKNAGQSTGVALLLGLVFGWTGLLAVYLMGRSSRPQTLAPTAAGDTTPAWRP